MQMYITLFIFSYVGFIRKTQEAG